MHISLAFYRLPIATAPLIGQLRAVVDRNGQIYLDGNRVIETIASGEFLVLTLANESTYYVKSSDYQTLVERYRKGREKR